MPGSIRADEGRVLQKSVRIKINIICELSRSSGSIKVRGVLLVNTGKLSAYFVSDGQGFEKKFKTLTACIPYTNAVKLQFGNTTITLMVPDGNAANQVVSMISQKIL